MEATKTLERALKTLGYPYARIYYKDAGAAPVFFIYQISAGIETAYADDDAQGTDITFRMILYAKENYEEIVTSAITVLKDHDFYGITYGPEMYEQPTGYYVMPIEFKYFTEV